MILSFMTVVEGMQNSLNAFRKSFWYFGDVMNRHRVADKTMADKTQ